MESQQYAPSEYENVDGCYKVLGMLFLNAFFVLSLFLSFLSINCMGKKQEYEAFFVLHVFLLLKYSFIDRLLSPCWNFHFCGSKQTPFRGGRTLSPIWATEAVTQFVFFLSSVVNTEIRFFLLWDFS